MLLISAGAAFLCSSAMGSWNQLNVGTRAWSLTGLLAAATQWGLPALFACLCAVLLNTRHALSVGAVMKGLLPRALAAAACWWALCAADWMQNNYAAEVDLPTFVQCLGEVLEQPVNLVLLLAVASAVLLYPLLWPVAHQRRIRRYCLALFLVFAFLLPLIRLVPYLSAAAMFTDQLNWGYFTAWGFYLLLGAEILLEEQRPWTRTLLLSGGLIATGLSYAATSWMTDMPTGFFSDFLGIASPLTAMQTAAVLVLAKALIRSGNSAWLTQASKTALGCFPAVYLCFSFLRQQTAAGGLWATASMFLLSLLLALLLNLALLQIPGFRILTGAWLSERNKP